MNRSTIYTVFDIEEFEFRNEIEITLPGNEGCCIAPTVCRHSSIREHKDHYKRATALECLPLTSTDRALQPIHFSCVEAGGRHTVAVLDLDIPRLSLCVESSVLQALRTPHPFLGLRRPGNEQRPLTRPE